MACVLENALDCLPAVTCYLRKQTELLLSSPVKSASSSALIVRSVSENRSRTL